MSRVLFITLFCMFMRHKVCFISLFPHIYASRVYIFLDKPQQTPNPPWLFAVCFIILLGMFMRHESTFFRQTPQTPNPRVTLRVMFYHIVWYVLSSCFVCFILLLTHVHASRVYFFLDKPQQTPNPRVVDAHLIILLGVFYHLVSSLLCVTSIVYHFVLYVHASRGLFYYFVSSHLCVTR
jgi:hypothetical protein